MCVLGKERLKYCKWKSKHPTRTTNNSLEQARSAKKREGLSGNPRMRSDIQRKGEGLARNTYAASARRQKTVGMHEL